ncbi:hypothetical protein [Streptomyces sp. XD-27]|uniref:hypothetical protein n=1 Tax=Streptomyces sp. XD-27 TaxID=3062779 RepID=UPI0026F45366|nr:hypothetical protein [Streptomyces sp. XD-27]WKX70798.1 hypothetical protein Q3Y56_13580 [Streptomyces sp. XD-27]
MDTDKRMSGPRRAALAALVTLSALGLTTACGGSDGDDAKGRSPLEPYALVTKDLTGYTVTAGKADNWSSGQPEADRPECRPLAHATGDKPSPDAKDTVARGVNKTADPAKGVSVSLSSYSAKRAKSLIGDIEAALADCRSGFEATLKKATTRYTKVHAEKAPSFGDDAVAYSMAATSQGDKIVMNFVAVRSDRTVALFAGFDLRDYGKGFKVPEHVVERQLAKLEKLRKPAQPGKSGSPGKSGTPEKSGSPEKKPEPPKKSEAPEKKPERPETPEKKPEKSE